MLFLLFQLGNDRYAMEINRVVEIVPLLELKRLPQAPKGVAGLFNYRGQPVPAIDLSELALGHPARECLSTRIIIVRHSTRDGQDHLLGLIAEHATEMLRRDPDAFVNSGVQVDGAPYLGPVLMDSKGVVQWIREDRLLPADVLEVLFARQPALLNATH